MGKYSGLLYCNGFFVSLLILTIWSAWIFCREYEYYVLKNSGERVIGKVVQFDVTKEKSLHIRYVYHVGEKEYMGSKFYRKKNSYDSLEIENLVKRVDEKRYFAVYYVPDRPDNSVCFITNENLRLDKSGVMILMGLWGIFGLGYLQIRIWNRNG